MATSQKAIAFNVEMDFTLKDTPGSIVKKIKAAEEKIEMRRSLSKEDLDAKLETAVFRKKVPFSALKNSFDWKIN